MAEKLGLSGIYKKIAFFDKVVVSSEIQSMTKETEVIIKENSVSSSVNISGSVSGTVNIPIYRVDLSLAFRNLRIFFSTDRLEIKSDRQLYI